MALGTPTTLLDADSSRSHGTGSYTTGSSSAPTSGSKLIAHVAYCTNGGGDPGVDITLSDSLGHTWTAPVAQQRRQGSGLDWIGEAFFVADNSSTSTFTITVDTSAGNIYAWEVEVVEVTGGSGGTIGATGSVSSTGNGAVNITLSGAPASAAMVIAGLCTYETNDNTLQITPGAGWTEVVEAGKSVPNAQVQRRTGSTSTAVDWSDNGTSVSGYLGLAFELVEAASGTTGTIAVTAGADTSSAAGTPKIVGTVAVTSGADVSDASGNSTVFGTVAVTAGADTSSAAGSGKVVGTIAVTAAADTSSAAGTPTVTGTIAVTAGADVGVASDGGAVTGTIAVTQAADTSSAAGTPRIVGTISVTAGADTPSAAGAPKVTGTLAVTQAADTPAASGSPKVTGSIAATQAADTASAAGTPRVVGTISVTAGGDVMLSIATGNGPVIIGRLTATIVSVERTAGYGGDRRTAGITSTERTAEVGV